MCAGNRDSRPPMPEATQLILAAAACSLAIFLAACTGSGNSPIISVSLSPTSAIVQMGAAGTFSATVANDAANEGVRWTVTCSAASCGSVSPTMTASGAATSYTAASNTQGSDLKVLLTATSLTDPTKMASAAITVPAVLVSISPPSAVVQAGQTQQLNAAVASSGVLGGGSVNWTLACPAAQCGTISPSSNTNLTTYTAPAKAPTSDLTVTLSATSVADAAGFASAIITIPATTVSISPGSAAVPFHGTQQFMATVGGNPGGGSVIWSVVWGLSTCVEPYPCSPPNYVPCSPTCGTVSPTSTASGVPATYTAPASFTPPGNPGCIGTCDAFTGVFLQANSTAESIAFSRVGITFQPPSLSLSPASVRVVVNATQQFTATVTNDLTNSGVTWTLSQKGRPCTPECGTVTPTSTASGTAATYTAPANVPALPSVTVTATSIEDPNVSTSATITATNTNGVACGTGWGNESLLKGQYAFLLQGGNINRAGSFTADGTGKVTVGEVDDQAYFTPISDASIDPPTSFYAVGPDRRGCLGLTIPGEGISYFRFALSSPNSSGIATTGRIIEFDDPTFAAALNSGIIRLQDATSFSASQFKGNYAMGLMGNYPDAISLAGTFVSDGSSTISSGTFDLYGNGVGTSTNTLSLAPAGTFTCCSGNGRGNMTLQVNVGNSFNGSTLALAFYMINSSDVLLLNSGQLHIAGEAKGIPSGTVFSQASLNGVSVIRESGFTADLALASADGIGLITTHDNINSHGVFTTNSTSFNYAIAANGRVTLSGGTSPPVLYLIGQNQGFLIGTDPQVLTLGFIEPQALGPFSDASLSGGFVLGTEVQELAESSVESGLVSLDGVGNVVGTTDQSGSDGSGLMQNQGLNSMYSISADGTGNFGMGTTAILISANKLVFISNTSAKPTVTIVEK